MKPTSPQSLERKLGRANATKKKKKRYNTYNPDLCEINISASLFFSPRIASNGLPHHFLPVFIRATIYGASHSARNGKQLGGRNGMPLTTYTLPLSMYITFLLLVYLNRIESLSSSFLMQSVAQNWMHLEMGRHSTNTQNKLKNKKTVLVVR